VPLVSSSSNPNLCRTVEKKFYPGVLMTVARAAAVRECEVANALDFGTEGNPPGSCYNQCDSKTYCVYGVPND
jgi:hypothetical protein